MQDDTVSVHSFFDKANGMDATGKAPYYINLVNSVMSSEHGLTLTMSATSGASS